MSVPIDDRYRISQASYTMRRWSTGVDGSRVMETTVRLTIINPLTGQSRDVMATIDPATLFMMVPQDYADGLK